MVPTEDMQYDTDVHAAFIVPDMLAQDYWGYPLENDRRLWKITAFRRRVLMMTTSQMLFGLNLLSRNLHATVCRHRI